MGDKWGGPGWPDADPRPPYGGEPGSGFRSARKTPAPGGGRLRGSDRPAAWEGPGWYRDDSDPLGADPLGSVEMAAGPHRADEPAAGRRGDRRGGGAGQGAGLCS